MIRTASLRLFTVMGLFLFPACEEGPPSSLAETDQPLVLQDSEKKLDHLTACAQTAPTRARQVRLSKAKRSTRSQR